MDDEGKLVALGYAGRGLKSHEANYSAYLLKLAVAMYGLDKFHTIKAAYFRISGRCLASGSPNG